MFEKGVVEPVRVKKGILKSATEAATMLLLIDDIITTGIGKAKPQVETESIVPPYNFLQKIDEKNWMFLVSVIKEAISTLEERKIPSSLNPLLMAIIYAEEKSDIDRDLITTLRTHLVHVKAFTEIGTQPAFNGFEEAKKYLERALKLLKNADQVTDSKKGSTISKQVIEISSTDLQHAFQSDIIQEFGMDHLQIQDMKHQLLSWIDEKAKHREIELTEKAKISLMNIIALIMKKTDDMIKHYEE